MTRPDNNNELPGRGELKTFFEQHHSAYEAQLHSLYQAVRKLLEQSNFTPTIKYRIKRFEPFYAKARKLGSRRKLSEHGITDLFGLRIISPFLEDIDTIERLLSERFQVVEVVRKANQHSFREFGYDSVHLLIRLPGQRELQLPPGVSPTCEIQLRTILQDAWAEVEHELVYKSDINLPNVSIRRKLASLNATLTLSDVIFQEIRDYQKQLRQLGDKRRASLHDQLSFDELIGISLPADEPAPLSGQQPPPNASRLEHIMLSALDAHSNNDYSRAIGLYDQLIGMRLKQPLRSLVYNHRGMAWYSLGEYRKSLHDFNKAIQFNREYSRGYSNRGLCYRLLNQLPKAVEDFSRALQLDPASPQAWFGRAQCYQALQLPDQASDDCRQALQIDPEFLPAQQLLQRLRAGN